MLTTGGYWSSYWYDGRIYATEIIRGLDVFALEPSAHLTANEIAAAALAEQGDVVNPQQQFPVSWPDHPVVALAYLDQLMRDEAVGDETAQRLYEALELAADHVEAGTRDRDLAGELRTLSRDLPRDANGEDATERLSALRDVIDGVRSALR